ncbi:extra-large guanine nucleotide-binding protein 1-like [Macadamia integrifolia]|uniref:extra-large guanine nucleotide-binding protein 1-like n=1 Tax=Macadamia integrifolia TaxID=60698 RepID=UPI001C4FFE4F|nr:extra-large guanine nucleotide-binding protein 1-like [Macadamia integrifolia]XP_042493049.1 extra-large guanine nucleotide-binding protein 1-like [Macadamia integrifolia]XP_042493050.1 extra-large guanine nucleotide-binding protein 1-like [Macadamia integrifolia]XP_042493052.1 extra-large guanine nucleotide-binding protein 1-like [Macadamia integrifolia]XP_042493053.1 extra-large guanine nucleotide-binding protein 1-like [Macadamia integrifolia]XP_042493054.1 extra-large guanine nucleotide
MKGVLGGMLPVGDLVPVKEDDVECSFAMEYKGPLVSYDLPRAVPIDIRRIPTAAVVAPSAVPDKVSLPVVQPLLGRGTLSKKLSKELTCGSDADISPNSVIAFEPRSRDSYDYRLSDEFSNSGTVGFSNDHRGCCDSSDVIDDSSGVPDFSNSRERSCELSGGLGSSGTLDFSNSHDDSNDLSGSSGALGSSNDCKESLDFVEDIMDDINPPDWGSHESSLHFLSSEISSCQGEDANEVPPCHDKRTSVVTFLDAELSGSVHEEESFDKVEVNKEKIRPGTKGPKGSCYRCYKGNRFTEKEVCIVCNAKYCSNCVLRAMGSMPEGRKCVSCIGIPIDESKRGSLGKCSRMLKRLLSQLEIQQIMNAEKLCEANQLQPELIVVNGKELCQEELVLLQSCANPPKKLKPGRYWYDKVSGLWGKEGQKPSRIITADLKVGGRIMQNASNGNTGVLINYREITKVELRMLQLAGVQCAGKPHFWLNADGSYQEEGQKNMKGNIWDKSGAKLVCVLLSLPVPCKVSNTCEGGVNNLVNGVIPDYFGQRALQKLLLAGYKGSGSSTIFKQAKILYNSTPFSEDELENIKLMIQSNVYRYLAVLLEGREHFEEESLTEITKKHSRDQSGTLGNDNESDDKVVYSIGPRLKAFSDWLLKVMVSGNLEAIFPAATREYAPLVEELWKDAAIQATYNRRRELQMLPTVASYFLERVVEICKTDYEPSNMDILYAEGITSSNGLAYMDFSFPRSAYGSNLDTADVHDPLLRYQLIRVDARSLKENCKWLEMFEDVRLVIFCVSLTDYDQSFDDGNGVAMNKMLASRRLFESIVTHPSFNQIDFLLILNKFDLFEQKIEHVPLTVCDWFNDFNPVISRHRSNNNSFNNNSSLAQQASYYIGVKFKRLFSSFTDRKLYVSMVNGLDPDTVDQALHYASEVLKWDDERAYFSISEYSIYSTEASSISH